MTNPHNLSLSPSHPGWPCKGGDSRQQQEAQSSKTPDVAPLRKGSQQHISDPRAQNETGARVRSCRRGLLGRPLRVDGETGRFLEVRDIRDESARTSLRDSLVPSELKVGLFSAQVARILLLMYLNPFRTTSTACEFGSDMRGFQTT